MRSSLLRAAAQILLFALVLGWILHSLFGGFWLLIMVFIGGIILAAISEKLNMISEQLSLALNRQPFKGIAIVITAIAAIVVLVTVIDFYERLPWLEGSIEKVFETAFKTIMAVLIAGTFVFGVKRHWEVSGNGAMYFVSALAAAAVAGWIIGVDNSNATIEAIRKGYASLLENISNGNFSLYDHLFELALLGLTAVIVLPTERVGGFTRFTAAILVLLAVFFGPSKIKETGKHWGAQLPGVAEAAERPATITVPAREQTKWYPIPGETRIVLATLKGASAACRRNGVSTPCGSRFDEISFSNGTGTDIVLEPIWKEF